MHRLLTFFCLLTVTASQGTDKVLGGEECPPHSQPWQVALFEGSRFNCGASLISNQWLLTAAHCNTSRMRVRLGEHNLRVWDGVEQLRGVVSAFPHPRYESRGHHDDIMLLRLTRPVSLSACVRPVALPTRCPRPGDQCVVSGWGLVAESKEGSRSLLGDRAPVPTVKLPDTLHCANISIISTASCNKDYLGKVTDTMVCAGVEGGGTDSCEGDSGGPLVCGGTLQGIVSWGDVPCDTTTKPGVYTKVCKYLGWIRDVMKKH
ncbi:kallikrein-15-like [Dromiciops gliroides]|uniref:kallikrein-15-like n=1 Tax=Dromiciops gliroides TaxID=33562 RepID=UPI001CC73424|nr:kallikrein-15-like [Dromiciops gliroides]